MRFRKKKFYARIYLAGGLVGVAHGVAKRLGNFD
jgi:hypothetical protein